jgi:hypothetical protein
MSVAWQKLRVPLMERLALADMAERSGKTEEEMLACIIRDAVKRKLANDKPKPEGADDEHN